MLYILMIMVSKIVYLSIFCLRTIKGNCLLTIVVHTVTVTRFSGRNIQFFEFVAISNSFQQSSELN